MDFYDVVENRKSIKRFKSTEVKDDKLGKMINAAMMAPSWKNKTSYKFVIVDDDYKKNIIASAVKNSSDEVEKAIKEAPVVALIAGEPEDSGNIDGKPLYLVDSAIAMEHFILAASNEGYGTCWIASFDENTIRDILDIPNNFKVVALTPIGEIAEEKQHNPVKNVNEHVFLNKWNVPFSKKHEKTLLR
ncbi:nitroreductase [Clostridium pasteurianum DSM 525 = ATCC 6013]|uniref:Nitroreductase n=1 Tax=Clostridium pasteurianum DSM 525 = ATCC 6013 TaxID=1262449 RepID=A0A0H3J2V5_CLOPA|nr:nitroreductase family protein [Clostridium pasteurianum]AJA47789.1 nitroreductase [Clostridium pasteurianum DSM 525 = ATCC 6013]AJA51777.1 nitroreductase [Clostridium pasteurianum DSM 525 = ATCC 6013]AOZ75086.1 nitroreductase [Clostridium pasteurianum DSM 525 = ATCC 6013]AOZ78881.1 nitroreductase [Clostridium pasteurianum]ELP59690.1 nitroreductase [Clostridium pasteurianum DSM 525 = ATCC 6013]